MKDLFRYFDEMLIPVIIVDKSFKAIYTNHFFCNYTGLTAKQIERAKSLKELFGSDLFFNFIQEGFTQKKSFLSSELSLHNKKQNITHEIVAQTSPIEKNNDQLLVSLRVLDVEKRLHEKYAQKLEELKEGHAALIQANKLSTLGELVATISHEITNPLSIASGNCELMELFLDDQTGENAKIQMAKAISDVRSSIDRINTIVLTLSNYLKESESKKQFIKAKDVMEHSIELISPIIPKGITIKAEFLDSDTIIYANPVEIEQVIINLVKNATQALTKDPHNIKKEISLSMKKNVSHNYVDFTIANNGPMIPRELQGKIFDTFFTTKSPEEGAGLGLSIAQKFTNGHQGVLALLSSDEKSTAFLVSLPTVELHLLGKYHLSVQDDQSKLKTILILSDNCTDFETALLLGHSKLLVLGTTSILFAKEMLEDFPIDFCLSTDKGLVSTTRIFQFKTNTELQSLINNEILTQQETK